MPSTLSARADLSELERAVANDPDPTDEAAAARASELRRLETEAKRFDWWCEKARVFFSTANLATAIEVAGLSGSAFGLTAAGDHLISKRGGKCWSLGTDGLHEARDVNR